MKQKQKKESVFQIVGGIALATGMCIIIPKIIEIEANFISSKYRPSVKLQENIDDDDWGPEIVRKDSLED